MLKLLFHHHRFTIQKAKILANCKKLKNHMRALLFLQKEFL